MSNLKVRFSDRVLSVVLAVMMVVSVFPITTFATTENSSVLTTNIGQQTFKVGVPTEFTFTTTANDDAGIMVVGTSDFSDSSAIEKLEYLETKDGKWYEFAGDFGPSTGFPMSDATSTFRVTFNKSGTYSFSASMKTVEDGSTLCSTNVSFTVNSKDKSILTTDIGEKDFIVGEATEFTFTTTANDYAGVMVIGTSDFSDDSAIEKLEYYETQNGKWYELTGDFGPSTGFPMSNATSRFRVTFKKGGDYTFTASMKYADGENKGEVLCASGEIKFHVKDKYVVAVDQSGEGTVKLNGEIVDSDGLAAVEGETVSLSVSPEEGWQISSVAIDGASQVITDRESFEENITIKKANISVEVTFVKVYTVTVDYESTKGAVVTSPESTAGVVTVDTGTTVNITATPNESYRVTKVEITGKTAVEFSDNTYNTANPYKTTLTADKDYTVKITFAPLAYDVVIDATTNGTVTVNKDRVEYGDNVLVTLKPAAGYTIDTAKVNNKSIYTAISETDDESVFEFIIDDIQEDQNIAVTFKECETTTMGNVSWNSADALRKDGNLYVFANDATVTFSTEKQGVRVTDSDGNIYGDKDTQSITFKNNTQIKKVELRYDFGWHEVLVDSAPVNYKIAFDAGKPVANIKANAEPNANGYYNSDVELTISAKDSGDYSGVDYLEYWIVCDGEEKEAIRLYTYEANAAIEESVSYDDVKVVAAENNSENVTVYVRTVDRAGNEADEQSLNLKICITVPSVSIKFEDAQSEEANSDDIWYNFSRKATISVNDRADVFDETAATNGIAFAAGSADGYTLSEWANDDNLHTATITFTDEGTYDWSYSYTNKADLDATISKAGKHTDAFKIDKTAPFGTMAAQSSAWGSEGHEWSLTEEDDWRLILEKLKGIFGFGLFANEKVFVGLKNDVGSDLLSGFQTVTYYVSNEDEALTESALVDLYNDGAFSSARIEISQDEQFSVYARIVDNAGNIAFIGTNGVIYDLTASDIEIDVTDKPNGNSIYGVNQVKAYDTEDGKTIRGINADIEVTDNKTGAYYSGIKKIEYVVSMGMTPTQSGTLYEFKNAKPEKKDLTKEWSGSVIIDADKNNGKDVTLTVTVTDNAGNTSEKSVTIKEINIDDITSTVTMTGKAVKIDDGFGWYNAGRTAFITIIDRGSTFDAAAATAGIIFETTDKDGNPIEVSDDDVSIGDWNNSGDLHTVTVMFNRDGKYNWHLDYTNKAENKLSETNINYGTSESVKAFTIDTTAPHGTVTVSGYSWTDKLLSVLTFGLYSKEGFTLDVSASDDENISPVTEAYYKYSGSTALSWAKLDSLYNSGEFSKDVTVLTGEQQFTVYVRITDNAGNYIYVSSDGHVIDATQTELDVAAIDLPNENGIYGLDNVGVVGDVASGIRVSVSAKETDSAVDSYAGIKEIRYEVKSRNSDKEAYTVTQSGTLYSLEYERNSGENSNGGKLTINDVNSGTKTYDVSEKVPTKEMLCREWAGVIVVDADANNKCYVLVTVTVTDNAGNSTSENLVLDVDITPPSVEVSFDNNRAQNERYFAALRTATVAYTERTYHFDQAAAEKYIRDSITAVKLDKSEVKESYTISWSQDADNSNLDTDKHIATVQFITDANYTFDVACTDKAGNTNGTVNYNGSVAPTRFTVDRTSPEGSVTVNGWTWSKVLDTLTFGLFSRTTASVSVTAKDDISPVKIEYYRSNSDTVETNLSGLELTSIGEYSDSKDEKLFDVTSKEQFAVYVKVSDSAGNFVWFNSDGYIVDRAESAVSVTAVDPDNGSGYYGIANVKDYSGIGEAAQGIKAHIDVNETDKTVNSGIKSIKYEIISKLDGEDKVTQSGTLYSFDYTHDKVENSNGGILKITDAEDSNTYSSENSSQVPTKEQLKASWNGDIIVDAAKNNSCDVRVVVTVEDNAGNINSDTLYLDIDLTPPSIKVTFNNNNALNDFYFDAPRTATVVITERTHHFNSAQATENIINLLTAKIHVDDKNYNNELKKSVVDSISGWTENRNSKEPDKTTWTATVEFSNDGVYTFGTEYTDLAGNANMLNEPAVNIGECVAWNSFVVDTTEPDAVITVNEHSWDRILKILTFGLYSNTKAEVEVESSDVTSPIKTEYYKTNDPIAKTVNELDELYEDGKFVPYKEFTVKTNEQFVVYVRITDDAGNYKYISSDGYIVDHAGPNLTLTPDEPNDNNIYNRDVNIKIDTSDDEPYSGISKVEYWVVSKGKETQRQTLFNFDYTREEGENTNKRTLVITDWADGTEKITNLTGNVPTQAQLYADWSGSFVVDASLNDSSDVKVYVGVTDNAGNYTEKNISLDIDITDPVIKVTYDSTANDNAKDGYYTERTATVAITERTNHFDASAATNGIIITAVDAKGVEIENAYTISAWTTVEGETPNDAVHTATIRYLADANYTFAIAYTDKADNENMPVNVSGQKNPYKFTVDKTAPVGTVTAKSAEGREETWSSIVDTLTFGFWSNTKISISGTSDDETSPIQSVEYYMPVSEIASDNTTVLKKADLDTVSEWQSFKAFDVTSNMQFTVYIKITDNAGNYTYIATNGLIVDEEHPIEESVSPEISVSPAKPVNGIYSDDVKVTIEVVDPMVGGAYSGLKEVSYAVFDRDSATPDKPTQEGTLFTFDMAYPKQSDLQQKWTGEITVSAAKNNSNNIQIVVYAKDNSLNAVDNSQKESKSYTVIQIDTTAPVIDISYDNNNADSGTYFKANRTATVTVTERNFNADDVKITITNTDGVIPAVVGWSNSTGTYNRDNATHTATITYKADGDYTFAIEYTDLAGNKCTSVNYASGTVAGTVFTIDKTVPTISVSYSNNSALNTNYYRDPRTATITINEHNFSTDRINITMTATDDGATASIPSVNGWSTNGDTHTGTITFANDSLYTFDIAYTDLAGNESADYEQDTFYVDNTDPTLEITPEALNGSANNGEVIPIVTSSDTNFDQVSITLTGANRREIKQLIGSYSDIHNGRVFTFANFSEEKEIDDIYTLSATVTDKAGRSVTKSVTFSVNRFGSTYAMDDNTKKLNNSYVQEATDVVITEINANALSNIKITLFKNNETIVLKSGTDYKIDETGGNGQWYQYVYTIFAKNFADDGIYRLSIHSEDAAGNIAENTLDTKDMEINFGVDSTLPTININNLESGVAYALENLTVMMSISDNLNLTKVIVYLDGAEYVSWSGDAITAIIAEGGNFSFDIAGDSTEAHTLKVVAVDAAGNELTEEIKDFYVTTNLWVRYYNNKVAFYGSIAGVIVVAGLIVFLVVWKRRKDEKNA